MELTITQPDDWHVHFRDGSFLPRTVNDTARQYARAIVMPNLKPPVTTCEQALAYRERILAALEPGLNFTPLMTLYLCDNTSVADIEALHASEHIYAVKYYPAGATTNSDAGLTELKKGFEAFAAMEKLGVPLLVHGETTKSNVDIFDREKYFIDESLKVIQGNFPGLKIVFEHITTKDAADFVKESNTKIGATITPQHLWLNRNALLQGGIQPHHYCLPVLKREEHRLALIEAACSGDPRFFLGSDSAPHAKSQKETACGCAGIYSAHDGIAFYAEIFEKQGALDKLEAFASLNGPDFYGLERNRQTVTLVKKPVKVPSELDFGDEPLVPFFAGQELQWTFEGINEQGQTS